MYFSFNINPLTTQYQRYSFLSEDYIYTGKAEYKRVLVGLFYNTYLIDNKYYNLQSLK